MAFGDDRCWYASVSCCEQLNDRAQEEETYEANPGRQVISSKGEIIPPRLSTGSITLVVTLFATHNKPLELEIATRGIQEILGRHGITSYKIRTWHDTNTGRISFNNIEGSKLTSLAPAVAEIEAERDKDAQAYRERNPQTPEMLEANDRALREAIERLKSPPRQR